MATEAPLFMHTQCTASVDMSAAGSLAGPNSTGQFLGVVMTGSRTVGPAVAASIVVGICQNDPKVGQAANIGFSGVSKAMVGTGGATVGTALIPTAAGSFTNGSTVAGSLTIIALETGIAGQVIPVLIS